MFDTPATYLFAVIWAALASALLRFAFSCIPSVRTVREMLAAAPAVHGPLPVADVLVRELIAAVEIMMLAVVFVFIRWSLPFDGILRGLIYAFAVSIVQTAPRTVYAIIDTSYPRTLVILDAARDVVSRLAMGVALGAVIEG